MARTKQTARKSTGGLAPRFRQANELLCWASFPLKLDAQLPAWSQKYGNRHLGQLSGVAGCEEILLARNVEDTSLAALFIVWQTPEHFDEFKQGTAYVRLLDELGVRALQFLSFQNGSAPYLCNGLDGRITLTVLNIPRAGESPIDEDRLQHALLHGFDAYISHACQGVRRPPAPWRLSVACADASERTRACCLFRWGKGSALHRIESAAADSAVSRSAFSTAIACHLPTGSTLHTERWDICPETDQITQDWGEDEEELDHRRLAGRILYPLAVDPYDNCLRFNYFLAETVLTESKPLPLPRCRQASAMTKVFSLPEVLSLILAHLPMKDLLLNQSVCRAWHSIINSTQPIQEKLFFRPRQSSSWTTPHGEFNSMLYERFPSFFMPSDNWTSSLGPWSDAHWLRTNWWYNRRDDSPYRRPEASWRRMIPCNPAPVEYQFVYYYTSWGHKRDWRLKVTSTDHTLPAQHESFMTFGCLHDIMERIWHQRQYFPAPNNFQVDFGPLSGAESYIKEEHDRDMGWITRHFIREVQDVFPDITFNVPGKILIELRYGRGCVTGPAVPNLSNAGEFQGQAINKEPTFSIELCK